MRRTVVAWLIYLSALTIPAGAESVRALVAGELVLNADNPEGSSINIPSNGSVVIRLGNGIRFLRGVELEISAPQAWLSYRGSLAMELYTELNNQPSVGVNDFEGHRIAYDPLPDRIRIVYQIPIRQSHGLRPSPYASVPAGVTLPSSFPILFRLMPIIKGISEELEIIRFQFTARPIFTDEGAVRINFRYPEQLRGKPFILLIDDVVIGNPSEELLLKEGGHHLVILSDDYRNESRRFIVEKAKILNLTVVLQDPTPIIIFEGPENARIFLNNNPVSRENRQVAVEPGLHEAKFQVGDYTLTRTITVQRGKTYRVALAVNIDIDESE
jgi:hypothetical protein